MFRRACLAALVAAAAASTCAGEAVKPRLYSRDGRFRIGVRRNNEVPISAILLQVYDSGESRWVGDQHFVLPKGEAADKEVGYAVFCADDEGSYPLRSIGHYQPEAGASEPVVEPHSATDPAEACDIVAVYDATAPAVELIEPVGGETFAPGAEVRILWNADDRWPLRKDCVSIDVSSDGGLTWEPVASGRPPAGRTTWKLPAGPAAGLRLRASAMDAAGNVGTSESNEFRRLPSAVEVVDVTDTEPEAATERPAEQPAGGPAEKPIETVRVEPKSTPVRPEPPKGDRAAAVKHYRKGVVYLLRGDYDEAAEFLEKAVKADPSFTSARVDLSVAYASEGRVRKASTLLQRSIDLFPEELAFRYNLGRLFYREGDYDGALAHLGGALSIKPGHVESLWLVGDIHARREELDSARHYWQEVIENAAPGNRWRQKAEVYLATSYGAVGRRR